MTQGIRSAGGWLSTTLIPPESHPPSFYILNFISMMSLLGVHFYAEQLFNTDSYSDKDAEVVFHSISQGVK